MCWDARSARSSTPFGPTLGARHCWRESALGETSVEELGAHVAIDEVYLPESGAGATYDELFGEFTNIYKKTKGIYRRLNG